MSFLKKVTFTMLSTMSQSKGISGTVPKTCPKVVALIKKNRQNTHISTLAATKRSLVNSVTLKRSPKRRKTNSVRLKR